MALRGSYPPQPQTTISNSRMSAFTQRASLCQTPRSRPGPVALFGRAVGTAARCPPWFLADPESGRLKLGPEKLLAGVAVSRHSQVGLQATRRTETMHRIHIARRDILKAALYGGTGLALGVAPWPGVTAEAVNFADIGVGDPGGDWSRYTRASGGSGV